MPQREPRRGFRAAAFGSGDWVVIVVAKARACARLGTAGGDRASTRASNVSAWGWG